MINSGMGLCLELAHDDKTGRSLWVQCEIKHHEYNGEDTEDVAVRKAPTPYIVATPAGEHYWDWGHYFYDFNSAYEYLMKGEI